jgi:hypothetical protein
VSSDEDSTEAPNKTTYDATSERENTNEEPDAASDMSNEEEDEEDPNVAHTTQTPGHHQSKECMAYDPGKPDNTATYTQQSCIMP